MHQLEPGLAVESKRRDPLTTEARVPVSVILPAYNEEPALPTVLDSVFQALPTGAEVIVVDDGSSDGTSTVAARYPCRGLRHRRNQGKGAAVKTGLRVARGDFLIIMDADNTYSASALPEMIKLGGEYDLVRCVRSRNGYNMPLTNRVGNVVFDYLLRLLHGLEGTDHLSGLYGLRRKALATLDCRADGFDIEVEIAIKVRAHRLRSTALPIDYQERIGEKKLKPYRDGWVILQRLMQMTVLYRPGLTFVAPGLMFWLATAALSVILAARSVTIGSVTLGSHALIATILAATVGFQIIVFGVAAALYGVERGIMPSAWLTAIGSRPVRLAAIVIGSAAATAGSVFLVFAVLSRLSGSSVSGDHVVVAGALVSWGSEVLLAALFLSIFAPKLDERVALEVDEVPSQHRSDAAESTVSGALTLQVETVATDVELRATEAFRETT